MIGIDNVIELTNKEGKIIEIIFVSKLSLLSQELNYYANIYSLYPKFIFYNNLNFSLCVNLVENINGKEKESYFPGISPKKALISESNIAKRTSCLSAGPSIKEVLLEKQKMPFYFFNKGSKNFICFLPWQNSNYKDNFIKPIFELADNQIIQEENFINENNFISNSNMNNVYQGENINTNVITDKIINDNHVEKEADNITSPDIFVKHQNTKEDYINFSPKKSNLTEEKYFRNKYMDTEENNNSNNLKVLNNNYKKHDINNIECYC